MLHATPSCYKECLFGTGTFACYHVRLFWYAWLVQVRLLCIAVVLFYAWLVHVRMFSMLVWYRDMLVW